MGRQSKPWQTSEPTIWNAPTRGPDSKYQDVSITAGTGRATTRTQTQTSRTPQAINRPIQ